MTMRKCGGCEGIWLPQGELLKFLDAARVGKIIEPDVKAAIKEWSKAHKENEQAKKQNEILRVGTFSRFRYWPFIIIPLYDNNPRIRKPWVTTTFLLFNIFLFFFSRDAEIFNRLGFIPGNLQHSSFITSMFLHGNLLHLISNLFFLWTFGDNVEDMLGPTKYIFYYFACGISALLAHFILFSNSMVPVVGASGAIAGLIGGYLYFFPRVTIKIWLGTAILDIPVWIYIGLWLFTQVMGAVFKSHSAIAFAAHLGGFIAGYIIAWALKLFKKTAHPTMN